MCRHTQEGLSSRCRDGSGTLSCHLGLCLSCEFLTLNSFPRVEEKDATRKKDWAPVGKVLTVWGHGPFSLDEAGRQVPPEALLRPGVFQEQRF